MKPYFLIRYREDITGISEATIIGEAFETLEDVQQYLKTYPTECDNPYFIHLAEKREDGHLYFLGDGQIIYFL
jgi:hypothetical protein